MTAERNETMWCTVCGARFTDAEIKGWGCPKCRNDGVPCGTNGDVKVEVNWHELHVLVVWAEQHAHTDPQGKMLKTVTAIARRLQAQFPDLAALTLAQEISELPTKLTDHGIGITGVTTNIPRPIPIPVNGPGAVGHSRERLITAGKADMSKKRLTHSQSDALAEAVRHKLGIVECRTSNGLGSASKRRMFNRLCVVGLLREYPHGGYEITPAGREAFLQNVYDDVLLSSGERP